MLDMFRYIIEDGAEVALNARVLLKELLPHTTSSFYRYFGSLTTPGCQEIVTWTIFHTPVVISESQVHRIGHRLRFGFHLFIFVCCLLYFHRRFLSFANCPL